MQRNYIIKNVSKAEIKIKDLTIIKLRKRLNEATYFLRLRFKKNH